MMFSKPDLARRVETLSLGEINALPFGVIKLDSAGIVAVYNTTEAVESGYGSRPALGLDFFDAVAPCMNSDDFKGRIQDARRRGGVDLEIGWVGDFDDRNSPIQVRVQSASDGGIWIFNYRN
ncbi:MULTISPECIES: hypothetical protein [Rhodopseudomonas]|uniref:Photoactive yellow protein n=1 Tax=Rhodopseudomonas palustris TaxID=1076 RepID=A0A0D7EHA9_RHOPL|nr:MULTISPECIES: hypothetical protein [Rhodopseudomonas]KIZ40153.1 hypothetical protein OO17_18435 [Rhodopseudomonas palustris]MDF3810515.1 hypothetical protein [Rhodopseudomonas sp. BAL398]WOK20228.1 hypothetical protein RBJ75_12220 [Rhodopseudomonas sp. BAL398]